MGSERKMSSDRARRSAATALCVGAALLLGGCAGDRAGAVQPPPQQQQALERARGLCRDFGYTPGSAEFARCAQSEYDRGSQPGAPQAAAQPGVTVPPVVVPTPAPGPQPAPNAGGLPPPTAADDDDWFIKWLKRPPVCNQAACSTW